MAATNREPHALETTLFGESSAGPSPVETSSLIAFMLNSGQGISDLIFSPGRPPQVEQHGQLVPVTTDAIAVLSSQDTARIARDVIRGNHHALQTLADDGACDTS